MNQRQLIGSQTARGGFENEEDITLKFNNYKTDREAQEWLSIMGYDYKRIKSLNAIAIPVRISRIKAIELGATEELIDNTIKFKKADIQVLLDIFVDNVLYRENLSLKKSNTNANFNQIDKRRVDTYQEMWGFNDKIAETLKKFTGEIIPNDEEKIDLRDKRRWYLDELNTDDVQELIAFFRYNKVQIFNDILKGRGALAAEWFLVTRKNNETGHIDWILRDINSVTNFFSQGEVEISSRGGLKIGRIKVQRKGGTPDPQSLQFKMSPLDLFND
ncbi:type II restriction endonuclease [Marinilabiliaceae bacterium JC040]|nr:type II restriction endonuclease [Marinilabiliaceae bacterium JC040]